MSCNRLLKVGVSRSFHLWIRSQMILVSRERNILVLSYNELEMLANLRREFEKRSFQIGRGATVRGNGWTGYLSFYDGTQYLTIRFAYPSS